MASSAFTVKGRCSGWVSVALALSALPTVSVASPASASANSIGLPFSLSERADADVRQFYAWRKDKPLWVLDDGGLSPAAFQFAKLILSVESDGIDPAVVHASELKAALDDAGQARTSSAILRAEMALSRSFSAYVRALTRPRSTDMLYEHQILRPRDLGPSETLLDAARAPSLSGYIHAMGWMHPLYAPLRRTLATDQEISLSQRQVVMSNLDRIRAIPAFPRRYVLVDAASAQLWMYENGRPVDSMRVVVGKPTHQTPMMAGYIRQAIFNPYWNVPDDLVQTNIAPNVLRHGLGYLKSGRYEVLSGWGPNPSAVDTSTIDWKRVANGQTELRVRQLPGQANSMGTVKFEFPNKLGIYLHDTPAKDLMAKAARQLSSGCIRLEDAPRLGRWLLNGTAPGPAGPAEQRVNLPEAVPIFVTYLTAQIVNGQLALNHDPYRRDGVTALASSGQLNVATKR